jgi:peptidyl-prolyl cis-trans isomerase C
VLSQEADKKGLAKQTDIEQTIALERQKILANHLIQDFAKTHPISDEQLQKEYDTQKARMTGKEFKTAHILVATEAEAKAIVAQLQKKGNFEKIAKEKSNDPGSKQQGGDLGWAQATAYVPEFATALAKLSKNQISEPVQTKFGWHVIKLNDVRDMKVPSFEEVKMQIQSYLQNQAIKKYVEELRANAKID